MLCGAFGQLNDSFCWVIQIPYNRELENLKCCSLWCCKLCS